MFTLRCPLAAAISKQLRFSRHQRSFQVRFDPSEEREPATLHNIGCPVNGTKSSAQVIVIVFLWGSIKFCICALVVTKTSLCVVVIHAIIILPCAFIRSVFLCIPHPPIAPLASRSMSLSSQVLMWLVWICVYVTFPPPAIKNCNT